jgi:hypothetical protein
VPDPGFGTSAPDRTYVTSLREVEKFDATTVEGGSSPTLSGTVRIHHTPKEAALLEPPLGQVSNMRPAMYLTDELYYDPKGVLVRTCISTPDKDWARRMPHRPWCNATEPPVAFGCTHSEQKAESTYPMGKGASAVLHGPTTYFASKAEERRASSCPATSDKARLGTDPAMRPEGFAPHVHSVPGLFPATQKVSPSSSPTMKNWMRRTSPVSSDHATLQQLPPRALHHLWNGQRTADAWRQRYTGERKIWAWNTTVQSGDAGRVGGAAQGKLWVCPWLSP